MERKFEELSLLNVAGGKLQQHFAELLAKLRGVIAEADSFESSHGTITCKMKFELDFAYAEDSGQVTVYARGGMTEPKRKLAVRAVFEESGKWFAVDEMEQMPLLKRPNVVGLRPSEKE